MGRCKHNWYRRKLGIGQDIAVSGDHQIVEPTMGDPDVNGMKSDVQTRFAFELIERTGLFLQAIDKSGVSESVQE